MSRMPSYGIGPRNWRLLLCAIGLHKWHWSAAGRFETAGSRRDCGICQLIQVRHGARWVE